MGWSLKKPFGDTGGSTSDLGGIVGMGAGYYFGGPAGAYFGGAAGSQLGGMFGPNPQEEANKQNIKLQKQFAQQGIQWRVRDAQAAGIHPLYALGAQTPSFSPSVVPTESKFSGLVNAGQNIARAAMATQSKEEKAAVQLQQVQQSRLIEGQIQNQQIRNNILQEEFNRMKAPGTPPGIPSGSPGEFATNDVKNVPAEVTSSLMGGYTQAGHNPLFQIFKAGPDSYKLALSSKAKEAMEDSPQEMFTQAEMLVRNGSIVPYPAPAGKEWRLDRYMNIYLGEPTNQTYLRKKYPQAYPEYQNRNLIPRR